MADVQPALGTQADWVRIEVDYRAGIKTLRQIAAEHGITEGAIRKRAKKEGWERDLAPKIQARADALVRKEAVREEVREKGRVLESETVEANARAIADVRLAQRHDIHRGRKLVMSLLDELEHQTDHRDLYEELGILLRSPDDKGMDKLNDIYMKAMSLSGRTDTMKKMTDSLKVLIGLEREAFGLATDGEGEGGKAQLPAKADPALAPQDAYMRMIGK